MWRGIAVRLLESAETVGAVVAWWYLVGGLAPLSFAEDLSITVWVLGLFIISTGRGRMRAVASLLD